MARWIVLRENGIYYTFLTTPMKRILLSSLVATSIFAFGYTEIDIWNAKSLANLGIIVEQSTIREYRLDENITRAEVAGIALKLYGTKLPDPYICKGYFSDVTNNNWICRAVELAADAELVSRANTRFRPQDKITRAEALAIILRARWLKLEIYSEWMLWRDTWLLDENLNEQVTIDWQKNVFYSYFNFVSHLSLSGTQFIRTSTGYTILEWIRPNDNSTRAEVFGFSNN